MDKEERQLDLGYTTQIDGMDKASWHALIRQFDDASFFQTWAYGRHAWGQKNLSHVILRKDGKAVSIVQLRIAKLPIPRTGNCDLEMRLPLRGSSW